ncbi:hypothetical protein TNCV_3016281 [Trichonephila clavipes]|nr:hypothetical protein TNCV_3016281 [Trichonephila clavipes]
MSGLVARRLFKVSPCRESTIHLQTSMSFPGFEPSPNGTALSVTNHYTGWAIQIEFKFEMKKRVKAWLKKKVQNSSTAMEGPWPSQEALYRPAFFLLVFSNS